MGIKDWLLLILLSILWGGSFFFIELAVAELPPFTIVWARVALAAITLWSFVLVLGLPVPRSFAVWGSFLVMGLLSNVLPFSLIVWGQTHIASGLASLLNATTPLFTVLVAGALLADEQTTKNKIVGVAIGFLGTVVMIGPSVLTGFGINVVAQLAILGAALSYAFSGVYGRRFKTQNIHPVVIAAGQVSAAAFVLLPIVLFVDNLPNIATLSIQTLVALIAMAVFSTALAYVIYFRLLASVGATNVSLVTFLVPISALLLGTTVLGEALEPLQIIGMGIIAIGLIVLDGRLWLKWRGDFICENES